MARNGSIFQDKVYIPALTSAQSVGLYKALPMYIRAAEQRRNLAFDLDKAHPWGFFDGAAQNELCVGGALLFLTDSHFFIITMGLGVGTNNFAELMSLKLLLIFATEKGVNRMNVLGDSMNVINWTMKIQECRNIRLANILSSIQAIIQTFDVFSCRHVYKENNKTADQASKEGFRMDFGTWKIREERDGKSYEFYHRPYID